MGVKRDDLVKELLSTLEFSAKGVIIKGAENVASYQILSNSLMSELIRDGYDGKLNRIRYKLPVPRGSNISFPFISSLRKLHESGNQSYSHLKGLIDEEISQIEVNVPIEKFSIYFQIGVTFDTKLKPVIIQDTSFNILQFQDLEQLMKDPELISKTAEIMKSEGFDIIFKDFSYLFTEIYARNEDYAIAHTLENANSLVSILTYQKYWNQESITALGIPSSYTNLDINAIFVFKDSKFINIHYTPSTSKMTNISFNNSEIKKIEEFNNRLQNAHDKNKDIILQALNVYHIGLTEERMGIALFNFWVAIEKICLKNESITENEVKKRVSTFLNPDDEYPLDRLYELRNQIAHHSAYELVNQYDRNLIKLISGISIHFFLIYLAQFHPQEIQKIFVFLKDDNSQLIRDKEYIDYILKIRKNHR